MKSRKTVDFKIIGIWLWVFLSFAAPVITAYAQDDAKKEVLVLHSYHKGYKWTDEITVGIEEVLGGDVNLWVEYMDTKRVFNEQYLHRLYELYEYKFATQEFDVIISSDDNAFNFLLAHRDELFPHTPVVFCGVNFFEDAVLEGHDLFTGVNEDADVRKGIEIALQLHPNTKQIAVVNDTTTTGRKMHDKIVQIIPDYQGAVDFIFLEDLEMAEVQRQVRELPPDSVVFYTVFFRDKAEEFYEYDESITAIVAASSVPVYVTWDFSLGYGSVGGMLASGFYQGETAAELARRVMQGERVADVPVVKQSPNRYMFDYVSLERFGIKRAALPEDSLVINEPASFYAENKPLVWAVGGSIGILMVVVVVLLVTIWGRRRAERELVESNRELVAMRNSLEQRVAERTRNLEQRSAQLAERTHDLERRSRQLEAAGQVARNAAAIHDVQQLLDATVQLISDQFGFYQAGVFMIDDLGQYAVLQAASSAAGQRLCESKYKLRVGEGGIVGYVTGTGEARIVSDVDADAVFLESADLPETRSEMAVPLKVRGRIIGALDVQSTETGVFSPDDVTILQTLADQVALAIENARLFQETQRALAEAQMVQRRLTREAWDGYVQERRRGA